MEEWKAPEIPQEIIIEEEKLQTNAEGKQYKYEKDGTYYGGDYLNEPPQEIDLDLPPPPTEENIVI